jgi:hypothetical protein
MIVAMGNSRSAGKGAKGGLGKRQMGNMGADIKLHEEAIAWVMKNAGQGKYAKVDKERMAVAGQSCGGIEASVLSTLTTRKRSGRLTDSRYNVLAKHPEIKTIGIFNSGTFSKGTIVPSLKVPIFYFLGGSSDIAYKNGERDYTELPKDTPVWKGNLPVGHMATYMQAKGGKFGTAMWKWLDWTLVGNAGSGEFFAGEGAKADGWTVEKRNLDKVVVSPIG